MNNHQCICIDSNTQIVYVVYQTRSINLLIKITMTSIWFQSSKYSKQNQHHYIVIKHNKCYLHMPTLTDRYQRSTTNRSQKQREMFIILYKWFINTDRFEVKYSMCAESSIIALGLGFTTADWSVYGLSFGLYFSSNWNLISIYNYRLFIQCVMFLSSLTKVKASFYAILLIA